MEKKVLVIQGSPRINGNSNWLAQYACDIFKKHGIKYENVMLSKLSISPCTGCNLCLEKKAKYCTFKDDMTALYEKVLSSSAILFATPVYWFTYTAQLKIFIDRLYGLWNWEANFIKGKKIGAIIVYGDTDLYSSGGINAVSTFEHMCRFQKADIVGFAYGTANEKGDAEKNADLVKMTEKLSLKLMG